MVAIETDVCIVGAGPGGALLGLLLARLGVSIILLERHGTINKEFRGEHLNQEGKEVLEAVGLYDSLQNLGILPMELVEYVKKGNVIKTIYPEYPVTHTGIHVPQKHLLKTILDEALKYPNFQLHMNSRVIDIVESSSTGSSDVIALMDGMEVKVKSKIIVGADGRFSIIRKKAAFPVVTIRHGYDLLWAKIPAPKFWKPTIKMALANGKQLALFTQYGNYVQIGWNIEEDSYSSIRKGSFQAFIDALVEEVPELKGSVNKHIQSWDDFVLLKVVSSKSPNWVKKNIVLLGDAAHTMSPTGAFGLNCALKDAYMLSGIISEIIREKEGLDSLKIYEEKRKVEVEAIHLEQFRREANFGSHFLMGEKEKEFVGGVMEG